MTDTTSPTIHSTQSALEGAAIGGMLLFLLGHYQRSRGAKPSWGNDPAVGAVLGAGIGGWLGWGLSSAPNPNYAVIPAGVTPIVPSANPASMTNVPSGPPAAGPAQAPAQPSPPVALPQSGPASSQPQPIIRPSVPTGGFSNFTAQPAGTAITVANGMQQTVLLGPTDYLTLWLPSGATWSGVLYGTPAGGYSVNMNGDFASAVSVPMSAMSAVGATLVQAAWDDSSGHNEAFFSIAAKKVAPLRIH